MIGLNKHPHSQRAFKRSTAELLRQMKETGRPVVLTINGTAEFVVQDATSCQQLVDLVDRLETIDGIQKGLASVKAGRTRPAKRAFDEIRRKHAIPR